MEGDSLTLIPRSTNYTTIDWIEHTDNLAHKHEDLNYMDKKGGGWQTKGANGWR